MVTCGCEGEYRDVVAVVSSFHYYGMPLKFFFTKYLTNNLICVLLINLLAFTFAINAKFFFKGFLLKI
jgi:hypothetical protein